MSMIKDIISHINCMLGCLENYIAIDNGQGCTDINVACENLILGMMNVIYDYNLENYNSKSHIANAKGIDLIDGKRKICVQVTSNHKISKLKDTIENVNKIESLSGYHLKFFVLAHKANNLRDYKIENKESLRFKFDAQQDIIDFHSFSSDIKRLSECKIHTLNAFFCCWLGEEYYNPLFFKEGIENKNQHESFERPEDYYPREISVIGGDGFPIEKYIYIERYKSHTLVEYIQNKVIDYTGKHWLLIAAGQTGKSYEVKNLAFLLSQTDDTFPVVFEAKNFKDKSQKINIPFYYSEEHIVFIIDGIDEISGEELRDSFYYQVYNLISIHPELRILMTCRRNYIHETRYAGFKILFLNDLSFKEIKEIVYNSDICFPDDFLNKIKNKILYSIVGNPFFLKAMMQYYKQNDEVQDNRLKLYRYLIDCSYIAENEKKKGRLIHRKTDGDTLLKKIALVLQFIEQKSISELELKGDVHLNDSDIELCMSFAIFHCDEFRNYSFELNSFQMYYVADFLMGKTIEKILDFISYNKHNVSRIRPEWYDVFELLLSSMNIEDERRKYLLEWTFENDVEALLNVDPNSLEYEFKDKIFKTILQDYKEKQIASSPHMGIDFPRKLASFCSTDESLQFFIIEYKNEKKLGPYLYLLSFVYCFINSDYIILSGYVEELKNVTYKNIKEFGAIEETKWYEALYTPLRNNIFSNRDDIYKLIELTNDISDVELKICIFRLIKETDLCDNFFYFTISNESYIHNYRRKGDYAVHMVSRDSVVYALTHIKAYENVKKLWINYSRIINKKYSHIENRDQHKFRCEILKLTEKYIGSHLEIIDYIKEACIYECKNMYLGYSSDVIIQDYRDFFIRNSLCYNLNFLCEEFYEALKGSKTYQEINRLYIEIILVITEDEFNKLAAEWDANDIYRCYLIDRLRKIPLPALNKVIVEWINKKFIQAKKLHENTLDEKQKNLKEISLIFDRQQFKDIINHIIEEYSPISRKELRIRINENGEDKINNYVMQYLQNYVENESYEYDIISIKESLDDDIAYHCFIGDVVYQNGNMEFTDTQKVIIKDSLIHLISHRDSIRFFEKVIQLILRFDLDLDKEIIVDLLPYAGVSYCTNSQKGEYIYFIDYVRKKLGEDIRKLDQTKISSVLNFCGESNWTKISELIVQQKMIVLYSDICKKINESENYNLELTDSLLNDAHGGVYILKKNFNIFCSEVQIHILEQLSFIPEHRDWVLETAIRYKSLFTSEENKKVLLVLLRLGCDEALDECIKLLSNNINSICSPSFAPSLINYADLRFLPKLIILLKAVWSYKDPFNNWIERTKEVLIKIAERNLEQYNTVNEALCKIKDEDYKYISNLSYFIDELKKFDPRLKEGKINIAKALDIINERS